MGLAKFTANTGNSGNSNFRQLDDQIYPMNDNKGGKRNETVIRTVKTENMGTTDLEANLERRVDADKNDIIVVTRGWDINSSARRE